MLTRHIEERKKGRENRGPVRGGQMNEVRSKPMTLAEKDLGRQLGETSLLILTLTLVINSTAPLSRHHCFDFNSSSRRPIRSASLSRALP